MSRFCTKSVVRYRVPLTSPPGLVYLLMCKNIALHISANFLARPVGALFLDSAGNCDTTLKEFNLVCHITILSSRHHTCLVKSPEIFWDELSPRSQNMHWNSHLCITTLSQNVLSVCFAQCCYSETHAINSPTTIVILWGTMDQVWISSHTYVEMKLIHISSKISIGAILWVNVDACQCTHSRLLPILRTTLSMSQVDQKWPLFYHLITTGTHSCIWK